MRIIAGEARGRRLVAPSGRTTRPILDQLKERLFNILGPTLEDLLVWDLFAGAGSLGLEAISRGAKHCLFVDRDHAARAVISRNLATLGWEKRAKVSAGNAMSPESLMSRGAEKPDLVFSDPPFPMILDQPDRFADYFDALLEEVVAPGGRLVFRYPSELVWVRKPRLLEHSDCRSQGANVLVVASAAEAE